MFFTETQGTGAYIVSEASGLHHSSVIGANH